MMRTNMVLSNKYPEYEYFLYHIVEFFYSDKNNTIHKARNEIKVVEYDNTYVVVKSFKIPNKLNQYIYSNFRDSKAKKSYENSIKIGDFTPEPIGYVEFFDGIALKDSFFVSKKFDYDFTIREPLLDENFQDRENIFLAFAKFSFDLHEAGIFHNDFSPGNILIKQSQGQYLFRIVDINRMKFYENSQMNLILRAKSFAKLWASDSVLEIIAREYLRYCNFDESFISKVIYFSNKNKKIKNIKKRLKGIEVND